MSRAVRDGRRPGPRGAARAHRSRLGHPLLAVRVQPAAAHEQAARRGCVAPAGRAGRFRLAGVPDLVERVRELEPDHILITGDLTTTALPAEFRAARRRWRTGWRPRPGDDHPGQPRPLHLVGPSQPALREVLWRIRAPSPITRGCGRSTPTRRSWGSTRPARASPRADKLPEPARRGARDSSPPPGSRPPAHRSPAITPWPSRTSIGASWPASG